LPKNGQTAGFLQHRDERTIFGFEWLKIAVLSEEVSNKWFYLRQILADPLVRPELSTNALTNEQPEIMRIGRDTFGQSVSWIVTNLRE
jgi:hypothetical protein